MLDVIILAGGKAWRLKPHTELPKPLLPLNDQTLLEFQLKRLSRIKGIGRVFITVNKKQHSKYLLSFTQILLDISDKLYDVGYVIEEEYLGTAGAIRNVLEKYELSDFIYVFNVDDIAFVDPCNMAFCLQDAIAIMAITRPRLPYGVVKLYGDLIYCLLYTSPSPRD